MKISQKGIDFIKRFEGCELTAYKCPAGVWTIGYGHTGNVREGQVIMQDYAETLLRQDLISYELKVDKYNPRYTWRQHEFDALVSFSYNIGSIDQLTANGTRSRKEIAEKMLLYNKAGGKVLEGLKRRRKAERELFLSSIYETAGEGQYGSESSILEYSLKTDGNRQISANFKVREFRCKDRSDKILVDTGFVRDKLQKIRDYFGAPITINSAYRTAAYNKKVGGASKSYHMSGQAFDIVVKGHTPEEVAQYAQSLGINGVIKYNTFVHVDSREVKYWAINYNGKTVKVSSF